MPCGASSARVACVSEWSAALLALYDVITGNATRPATELMLTIAAPAPPRQHGRECLRQRQRTEHIHFELIAGGGDPPRVRQLAPELRDDASVVDEQP